MHVGGEGAEGLLGSGYALRETDPAAARIAWTEAMRLFEQLALPDRATLARELLETG